MSEEYVRITWQILEREIKLALARHNPVFISESQKATGTNHNEFKDGFVDSLSVTIVFQLFFAALKGVPSHSLSRLVLVLYPC